MEYIAIHISISEDKTDAREIIFAQLDLLGYEGITELPEKLIAYIPASLYSKELLFAQLEQYVENLSVDDFSEELIQEQNWNAVWESNFDYVVIEDRCAIRAPFHKEFPKLEYSITIEPKMAFGTGHHQTTSLMVSFLLDEEIAGKQVLDMGCGTGVLAILAMMRQADKVWAIDYDKWSTDNTIENAKKNQVNLEVLLGGKEVIPKIEFDILLANINRNILLDQMEVYGQSVKKGGVLFLSGILSDDVEMISESAEKNNFKPISQKSKDNWQALKFEKI